MFENPICLRSLLRMLYDTLTHLTYVQLIEPNANISYDYGIFRLVSILCVGPGQSFVPADNRIPTPFSLRLLRKLQNEREGQLRTNSVNDSCFIREKARRDFR